MSNIPPQNDDETWDEFEWEQFMQEQDRKTDRFMELMDRYKDDPNKEDILAHEMGWDKDSLHEEGEGFSGEELIQELLDEDNEGEEWKFAAGLEQDEHEELEIHHFKKIPAFQLAHEFGLRIQKIVEDMPEKLREDTDVVDFFSNVLISAAKMAGGASYSDDVRLLGGNIAYCKRALNAANKAIDSLKILREQSIIKEEMYFSLFKDAKVVRDEIALYVVELRDRFRKGI